MKGVAVLLSFLLSGVAHAGEVDGAGVRKQELAVLYAGDPDDARTADFERFLGKHFRKAGTTSYERFTPGGDGGLRCRDLRPGKGVFSGEEVGSAADAEGSRTPEGLLPADASDRVTRVPDCGALGRPARLVVNVPPQQGPRDGARTRCFQHPAQGHADPVKEPHAQDRS